jgi:predicted ATPase
MISELYIDNFRCLVNFRLPLPSLALLLGGNGAGKSTVFDVLQCTRDLVAGEVSVTEAFPTSTRNKRAGSNIQEVRLDVRSPAGLLEYELLIEHDDRRSGQAHVLRETLQLDEKPLFDFERGEVQLYRDDHSAGPRYPFDGSRSALATIAPRPDNTRLTWFKEHLARMVFLRMCPMDIDAEASREDRMLVMSGSNFASWFRFLSQEYQDRILDLTSRLRDLYPGFRAFRLSEAGRDRRVLRAVFQDTSGELAFDFDELSDGQRVAMILYTLLYGLRGGGYSLFIDEPQNFVALAEIQPWLIALQDACGSDIAQAVLISHHPEPIDYLGAEAGIWLERSASGTTLLGKKPAVTEGGLKLSEVVARGWTE